ncbi:MAG: IS21 family transposase [Vulcanimicrobiota bacterium]
MITDHEFRKLRQLRAAGKSQELAAALVGVSEKTARKWEKSTLLPSQTVKPRHWRTRKDPFEDVWETIVVPHLRKDEEEILEATTLFDFLQTKKPGHFKEGQLRTLQRRIRDWRALHGQPKEVYFPQEHPPGREGQIDFTNCNELKVTIAGQAFPHLIFQFILSHSGYRQISLAKSETFEALSQGIQNAVWGLGGTPAVWRTDNLSAATHQLKDEAERQLTERYADLLKYYGTESTRINAGESNENGVVEKGNDILKRAVNQALQLRGSRDFPDVEDYWSFVLAIAAKLNRRKEDAFREEVTRLKALPKAPLPCYTDVQRTVNRYSCIRIHKQTYSVPSQLIGYKVIVRLHPAAVEVRYGPRSVETYERLPADGGRSIAYRHIIHSLVRKPGAFARYKYREELFPTLWFRKAYDALKEWRGERADVDYVRILHLAATNSEQDVEQAIELLLDTGERFDYGDLKALVAPQEVPEAELIPPLQPDLSVYDDIYLTEGEIDVTNSNPTTICQ